MRKSLFVAATGLGLSAAVFAAQDLSSPEARAYVGFSFGGAASKHADSLNYGLQLNHSSAAAREAALPPFAQINFSHSGSTASLNGMTVLRHSYRLAQNDTGAAPAADSSAPPADTPAAPADSSAAPADAGAAPADAAAPADTGAADAGAAPADAGTDTAAAPADSGSAPAEGGGDQGFFANWEVIDYVLLGAAAVGLGYLAYDAFSGDNKKRKSNSGSTSGGTTNGGSALPLLSLLPSALAPGMMPMAGDERTDPQYRQWLDGGTGQMGDLGG